MREVSRHLFIPRRPLIASMLSSDPERSWFRIGFVPDKLVTDDLRSYWAAQDAAKLSNRGNSHERIFLNLTGYSERVLGSFRAFLRKKYRRKEFDVRERRSR